MSCPHCSFDNPDGTLFCDDCNMPLPLNGNLKQGTSSGSHSGNSRQKPQLSLIAGGLQQKDLPRMIMMENMLPTGESLRLPPPPYPVAILLGRNDLKNGMVADIDLTSAGGFQKKVSRKHAYLGHDGKQFTISDAGSTHGTFINRVKLSTGQTVAIQPGDEVRLSELIFKIE